MLMAATSWRPGESGLGPLLTRCDSGDSGPKLKNGHQAECGKLYANLLTAAGAVAAPAPGTGVRAASTTSPVAGVA